MAAQADLGRIESTAPINCGRVGINSTRVSVDGNEHMLARPVRKGQGPQGLLCWGWKISLKRDEDIHSYWLDRHSDDISWSGIA